MATRRNFYLGLFVLGGVALLIVLLFAFGAAEMLAKKARLVTWFSESVQGLAIGSPVKYKGVPIGNVKQITIQLADKLIRVEMDVELNVFNFGKKGEPAAEKSFAEFIETERKNGLRCRLEYSGLTGMKYVEIDYFDPEDRTAALPEPGGDPGSGLYIPSKPSSLTDMLAMLTTSLNNIAKVDFEGISEDLRASARSLDRLLNDPNLRQTLSNFERMSKNLETSTDVLVQTLTKEELRGVLDAVHDTANGLQELSRELEKQLADARVPESTASFRDAMGTITDSRQELEDTLTRVNRALGAFEELLNLLNEDPQAPLRGKQRRPLDLNELRR